MKKQLAIYLAICSMAFMCTSCLDSDEDTVETYPYASLLSFSIGDLNLPTPSVTDEGKDTVIIKTVTGSLYSFIIDDRNGTVYNPDSLPKGCDITKVTTSVSSDGVAYFYSDESETYEYVESTDSIDFSSPRKLIIVSTDGTYVKEYTVSLNVHTTEPDAMFWESLAPASVVKPLRSVVMNGKLYVYGYNANNEIVVTYTSVEGLAEWSTPVVINNNFSENALKAVKLFNNKLYVVEENGALAESQDGINWTSKTFTGLALKTLLVTSDVDGKMWAVASMEGAVTDSIVYTADAADFVTTEALPDNFPLYDISSAVYSLSTNPNIQRYLLVGYNAQQSDAKPVVWSKLSTENTWIQLEPSGNGKFDCPALENLTVLHYDGMLYAFGGAGVVNEESVEPFSMYYVSRDNGLTWSPSADEKMVLPESLLGCTAPFTATVDNKKRMWIITGGDAPVVWRGVINRLAY